MTENCGVVFDFDLNQDKILAKTKINSAGMPMPGYSYKVVDLKTKENLGPNQVGEIRVKTKTRMKEYFRRAEATEKLYDEDGYLCTGDLGYYDDDFCFWIERRINDILIFRQWRVSTCKPTTAVLLLSPLSFFSLF